MGPRGVLSIGLCAALAVLGSAAPASAAPPANDDFANAEALGGGLSLSFSGTVVDAGREAGEPADHGAGNPSTAGSVWYSWTATESATVRMRFRDTTGQLRLPATRPFLAVYTGTEVGSLTPVALSFDSGALNEGSPIQFDVTSGTTYRLVVESTAEGTDPQWGDAGTFEGLIRKVDPPDNDDFDDAIELSGSTPLTFSGDNFDAGTEVGENTIGDGLSVWYRWTAPATGIARLTYDAETYKTGWRAAPYGGQFIVQTGPGPGQGLVSDEISNTWRFDAVAGETYYIQTYGQSRGEGTFTGRLALTEGPANDAFANAETISGGSPIEVAGSGMLDSTQEPDETGYTTQSGDGSVWFDWTAPISGSAFMIESDTDSAHELTAFTGEALDSLTQVSGPDGPGFDVTTLIARHVFPISAGTTYRIRYRNLGIADDFSFTLEYATRPGNDDFEDATALSGMSPAIVDGTTVGATRQAGEPPARLPHFGVTELASTWYSWTAPSDARVRLDFVDAQGDVIETLGQTGVTAFVGDEVDELTGASGAHLIGSPQGKPNIVRATAGTTYRIAVGGYERVPYRLRLSAVQPPANDDFAQAEELTGSADSTTGTTVGTTIESAAESDYFGFNLSNPRSAWYEWTAPTDGRARLTLDADFASDIGGPGAGRIWVFTGADRDDLDEVELVDPGDLKYRWAAEAGVAYRIAVVSSGEGPFNLDLALNAPPAGDDFADAQVLAGSFPRMATVDLSGATPEPGEPDHAAASGGTSAWFSFTPPADGSYSLDACQRSFDSPGIAPLLVAYTGVTLGALVQEAATAANGCKVDLQAEGSETYLIALDHRDSELELDSGEVTLTVGRNSVEETAIPSVPVSTGDEATPGDPNQVALTSPTGGAVSLTKSPPEAPPQGGYDVLGVQYAITAPDATSEDPLVLEFLIDESLLIAEEPLATYEVFRDGALVADCSGPDGEADPDPCVDERVLSAGDLLIRVLSSHASDWVVASDLVAPTVSFTTPDNRLLRTKSASVGFVSPDPSATFECSFDSGPFAPCSSPYATPEAADGSHTVRVRATDGAANVGATAQLGLRTDTRAPNTTLSKALPKGKVRFSFSADEQATFACKLDRAAPAPCSSPLTRKLKPGRHTFTVTATDLAGNPDASPATLSFKLKKKKKRKR